MSPGMKNVWSATRRWFCVSAGLLAGLGSAWADTLSGSALIRERAVLPADASFEVRLLDASAPGGPELQIAVIRKAAGQSPIRFDLPFDGSQVQPGQRYIVRATVSARGQVLYSAEPPVGVRLDGSDPALQLILVAGVGTVGGAATPPAGMAGPAPAPIAALPAVLSSLPARYLGDLLAGSDKRSWTLDLQADGNWRLRTEGSKWYDRDRVDETGAWAWDANRQRLVLTGGRESPMWLEPASATALRKLDRDGRRLAPPQNDLLLRQASAVTPATPGGPAGAAVVPVGPAPQPTSPLRGTYWKLLQLNGQAVLLADRQREPHLIIAADTLQVSGSGGCNRFSGAVEGSGDRIAIKQIAATRMACAAVMQQESAYFDALERSQRWRIAGSQLELLDSAGRVLARFEAVALR